MNVNDRQFRQATEALATAVEKVVTSTADLRQTLDPWTPPENSEAMAALVRQRHLGLDIEVVERMALLSSLRLLASQDHAIALCKVLSEGYPSVFAHHSTGRASIECAARSFLLLDPSVGTDARAARYLNERLASLIYVKKAHPNDQAIQDRVQEEIQSVYDVASSAGFKLTRSTKGRPKWIGAAYLGNEKAVALLLAEGDVPAEDKQLARDLYRRLSAMTHGDYIDVFATLEEVGGPTRELDPTMTMAGVVSSTSDIATVCRAVVLCYRRAAERHLQYFSVDPAPLRVAFAEAFPDLRARPPSG